MNDTTSRTFEFKDDKSSKFWEVTLTDSMVKVRFGKTGTNGQSQDKSFADAAVAAKHVQELIAEKTGKGYVELGATQMPPEGAAATAAKQPDAAQPEKTQAKSKPAKAAKPKNPAQDPEASPESLLAMLDKDDATNRLLARHPRASSELLEKLSHSSDKATRSKVVLNPNAAKSVLLQLAPQFPRFFFKNPAFDWLLLEDPDLLINLGQGVLKNILKILDCPESFMRWAVEYGSDDEKLAVAMNVNAPVQCLQELSKCYGTIRSAALGHSKLCLTSDSISMENVFHTELELQLHDLSYMEAVTLFEAGYINLPQFPFLNSAVRVELSNRYRAGPQISVECYLNEVDSPDPSELLNFLWSCYFNYEFENIPYKLEEINAVSPDYFQKEHIQLLIEVVEKRLIPFLRLTDLDIVSSKTAALVFLFSCMPARSCVS